MGMSKYGHKPHNWFEAVINKLGGENRADAFLRGELVVSEPNRSWWERNGIIYFTVTSDGTTGEEWIARLESQGFRVGEYAKQVLRSPDFAPTKGMTTVVAVFRGALFTENERTTKNICAYAKSTGIAPTYRKPSKADAELACLIREKFTDKEIEAMGLRWIIAMHEPINNSVGDPNLLGAGHDDGGPWLYACDGRPDGRWFRDRGFAFVVSENRVGR